MLPTKTTTAVPCKILQLSVLPTLIAIGKAVAVETDAAGTGSFDSGVFAVIGAGYSDVATGGPGVR